MTDLPLLLLRQTIQVSVVAAAVWLVTRAFARDRPHLAHALWALVLLKSLTPPLLASPLGPFCRWTPAPALSASPPTAQAGIASRPLKSLEQDRLGSPRSTPIPGDGVPDVVVTLSGRGDTTSAGPLATVASGSSPDMPSDLPNARNLPTGDLSRWLAYGWILSAALALSITALRVARFLLRAHRRTVATPEEILDAVNRLGTVLGVQRRFRVRVVDAAFGPAVIGIWRPTILLPQIVVRDSTIAQLEPLLAHELIHVRRGDLRWAMVQAAANSLWWFHPLVRLAANRLQGEAERCCDEETVRSLGCKPAAYARALLDVLERKQRLQVAPVLPGVRPLEITTRRLERIMHIGQGSHARSPQWASLVLLTGAAITLPGATWGQGDPAPHLPASVDALPAPPAHDATPASEPAAAPISAPGDSADAQTHTTDPIAESDGAEPTPETSQVLYRWDTTQALANIQRDDRCDVDEAKVRLKAFVHSHLLNQNLHQPNVDLAWTPSPEIRSAPDHLAPRHRPCAIQFHDTHMIVHCQPDQREAIEEVVERVTRHGSCQITVQTRLITIPADMMSQLPITWTVHTSPSTSPAISGWLRRDAESAASLEATAMPPQAAIGSDTPTLVSIVDATTAKQLIDHFQAESRANVLQAPKITLFNAQQATIKDLTQRPFVVSVTETLEPVIRVVDDGLTIHVRPTVNDARERVSLACALRYQTVDSVKEVSFRHVASPENGGVTLQVPVMTHRAIAINQLDVPLDGAALIAGLQTNVGSRDADEILIAMLNFALIDADAEAHARPVPPPPADQYVIVSPKISQSRYARIAARLKESGVTNFRSRAGYLEIEARSWRDAQPLVTELLREIVDEPPTTGAQADLLIAAEGDSAGNHELLLTWLKAHEMPSVAIQGNIRYSVDEQGAVIAGKNLTMQDGGQPTDFLLRGELAEIRFPRAASDGISAQLIGGAHVRIASEELEVTADEIQIDGRTLNVKGNVRVKHKGTSLAAERLVFRLDEETQATEPNIR